MEGPFRGFHSPLGIPFRDIEDSGGWVYGGVIGPKIKIKIRSQHEQGKGGGNLGHVDSLVP